MRIDVVTIFPDYLRALDLSLIGKAIDAGKLQLGIHDLRDWTQDRHNTVDDTPAGGGAGMVMRPDVWGKALDQVLALPLTAAPVAEPTYLADAQSVPAAPAPDPLAEPSPLAAAAETTEPGKTAPQGPLHRRVLVIPTPSGQVFTQRVAEELADADQLVFACGRYEGIDARVAEHYQSAGYQVRELSIGDYVLNGGEVATLVMVEAIARLIPGVIGNPTGRRIPCSQWPAGISGLYPPGQLAGVRARPRPTRRQPQTHCPASSRPGPYPHRNQAPRHDCAPKPRHPGPRRPRPASPAGMGGARRRAL